MHPNEPHEEKNDSYFETFLFVGGFLPLNFVHLFRTGMWGWEMSVVRTPRLRVISAR